MIEFGNSEGELYIEGKKLSTTGYYSYELFKSIFCPKQLIEEKFDFVSDLLTILNFDETAINTHIKENLKSLLSSYTLDDLSNLTKDTRVNTFVKGLKEQMPPIPVYFSCRIEYYLYDLIIQKIRNYYQYYDPNEKESEMWLQVIRNIIIPPETSYDYVEPNVISAILIACGFDETAINTHIKENLESLLSSYTLDDLSNLTKDTKVNTFVKDLKEQMAASIPDDFPYHTEDYLYDLIFQNIKNYYQSINPKKELFEMWLQVIWDIIMPPDISHSYVFDEYIRLLEPTSGEWSVGLTIQPTDTMIDAIAKVRDFIIDIIPSSQFRIKNLDWQEFISHLNQAVGIPKRLASYPLTNHVSSLNADQEELVKESHKQSRFTYTICSFQQYVSAELHTLMDKEISFSRCKCCGLFYPNNDSHDCPRKEDSDNSNKITELYEKKIKSIENFVTKNNDPEAIKELGCEYHEFYEKITIIKKYHKEMYYLNLKYSIPYEEYNKFLSQERLGINFLKRLIANDFDTYTTGHLTDTAIYYRRTRLPDFCEIIDPEIEEQMIEKLKKMRLCGDIK